MDGPGLDAQAGRMLLSSSTGEENRLDQSLAISMVNQLKQLIINSLSSDGSPEGRLEISKQASLLKQTCNKFEAQVNQLTAGDLSLIDQEELIAELESRIQIERQVLKYMSDTLPSNKKDPMPTTNGDPTVNPIAGPEHAQVIDNSIPITSTQLTQNEQEDTNMES
ncbi:hypothetical protein MJO29_001027 [Puccinia striiformis f. sp. tritici]|uniref:hypothetical protein n=1 Tax=Puccinia striiformis f. sp. tritici TaxID=168172 RepID=UPI0020083F27|nr:hypothetical protein Pst134EA_001017 [Puccinia striiformis f. sp. tritici]KAH9467206.1 hypothetical protein Pst134EB_002229 [Puccinia striiformis f. sp. tritici]KAH9473962.1 hypothetical protein Pst134EA_001017 [Puccinia striiformis f. sp. tritici]KAI7967750.1 hypothetical protein MJO29_001027 [Puccinia striiformis f. sp. tritici]